MMRGMAVEAASRVKGRELDQIVDMAMRLAGFEEASAPSMNPPIPDEIDALRR